MSANDTMYLLASVPTQTRSPLNGSGSLAGTPPCSPGTYCMHRTTLAPPPPSEGGKVRVPISFRPGWCEVTPKILKYEWTPSFAQDHT